MSAERNPNHELESLRRRAHSPTRNITTGLLVLLLLSFVPLGAAGIWMNWQTARKIERMEHQNNLLRVRTLAALVDHEIVSAEKFLTSIAERRLFRQAWEARDFPALERHFGDARALETAFLFVSAYEPDGTLRAILPSDPIVGQNYAHRDWYRGVTKDWRPYASEVYRTAAAPNSLVVAVAVPIRNAQEKPIGILMAPYALEPLAAKFRALGVESVGETFVVDQRGNIVTGPGLVPSGDPVAAPEQDVIGRAQGGEEASVRNEGDKDRFVAFAPVGNLGWTVLYRRSTEQALAAVFELRRQAMVTGFYVLLVYLVTAGIAVVLVGRQGQLLADNRALNEALEEHIVEQKRAQEGLDRYFTLSLDLLCVADSDGYFRRLNPAWEATLGFSIAELMGKPYLAFVHPDDKAATAAEAQRLSAGGTTISFENRYRCKDGTYKWLSWRAIALPEQRLIYATARDFTERKQAEAALAEAHATLQAVLDASTEVAIIATDPAGLITVFNTGAEKMLGYSAKEMVGQQTPEIIHLQSEVEERGKELSGELGRPIEGFGVFVERARQGSHERREWTYVRKDGSHLTVELIVTAFRSPEGGIKWFLGVARDITDRKRAEEAMWLAKEEAERTSRFKDQFLSTMSHELRTPLNAILGFSELLEDQEYGPLTERQRRYLNHIRAGGQHLLRLINDILDLSKIEAGRLELAIESVSVGSAFAEVLSALRPLADKKSQELLADAEEGLTVRADSMRLKQILMNLVGNAIKFTPPGGHIVLGALRKGSNVRLEIRDTGPGIPPEEQKRIFEAFVRLQNGRNAEGTGLGLAITQRLVELHGGRIELDSGPGTGSCFFFALPEAPAARQPRPTESGKTKEAAEIKSILVVEDDPAAAQLITSQLSSFGYEALTCGEPQNAVEMAATLRPLAITLDILMKPMNGFEVLLGLKNDARTKHIPVIILSIVDQAALGTSLGAEEYLVKPVEKATLLATIERCLGAVGVRAVALPILVVEDDGPTREIIGDILTAAGYAVMTAADGEQARACIAATLPELVILDLVLPEISGFELLAEWRANPRTAQVPVFVLTGKDLNEVEETYLRTHAETLFRKQQDWQDDLLRHLKRLVGRSPSEPS